MNEEDNIEDIIQSGINEIYLLIVSVMLKQGKSKEEVFEFIEAIEVEGERIGELSDEEQDKMYDETGDIYEEYISHRVKKELNF